VSTAKKTTLKPGNPVVPGNSQVFVLPFNNGGSGFAYSTSKKPQNTQSLMKKFLKDRQASTLKQNLNQMIENYVSAPAPQKGMAKKKGGVPQGQGGVSGKKKQFIEPFPMRAATPNIEEQDINPFMIIQKQAKGSLQDILNHERSKKRSTPKNANLSFGQQPIWS